MKIAVIGAGISGNGAAWALSRDHDVTVYERDHRPGGHSATVDIDYDGTPVSVDTGFIVYNEANYPDLTALFDHLGVASRETSMSFAVSAPAAGVEWSGKDLGTVFAQRRNLLRPSFVWMLREILRFNRQALSDRAAGSLAGLTLGDYLDKGRYSTAMRTLYLEPMGAAIWSTPPRELRDFPAEMFIEFFDNHRLLHHRRPNWRTVIGGSRTYVDKLVAPFAARMRLGADIVAVNRDAGMIEIIESNGRRDIYDHVVMATHSDQALRLLSTPSRSEHQILGSIAYRPNLVHLHRDQSLMPKRHSVWSAWNYMCPNDEANADGTCSVTYWMNALQGIDQALPLFVSLNPPRPPRPELTFGTYEFDHPVFDGAALAAQNRLNMIQGVRNTWFCGAYHGRGFHEDGLRSGLAVAERLGARIPWRSPAPRTAMALPAAAD